MTTASLRNPSFFTTLLFCFFFLLSVSDANGVLNSRQQIDKFCKSVKNPSFCRNTLIRSHSARVARNATALAAAVIDIGKSFAVETRRFVEDAIKKDQTVRRTFGKCADAYVSIAGQFETASSEVWNEPMGANYDVMLTRDQTRLVLETLRWAKDAASRTLIWKTNRMNGYIGLADAATIAAAERH